MPLETNGAIHSLLGIQPRAKITRKIIEQIFPDTEGRWIDICGKVAQAGKPLQFEFYHSLTSKYLKINAFIPAQGQFIALFEDITERKRAEKAAIIVRDLFKTCASNYNLHDILNLILEAALSISEADCGGIYLLDPVSGHLNLAIHKEFGAESAAAISCYSKQSRYAKIVMSGVPVYSLHEDRYPVMDWKLLGQNIRAGAAIPAMHRNQVVACLNLGFHNVIEIPAAIRPILETVANSIGGAVTHVKEIERLLESEEKYGTLVNEASDGVAIVQDGVFQFANKIFEKISGYAPAEAIGMPLLNFIAPEYRDVVGERYRERMAGKEPPPTYEVQIQCKDGTIKDTEISTSLVHLHGKPAVMAIGRDITERKAMEQKLRESEEKYATLVHEANDGVGIVQDSVFQLVNRAFEDITGYSAAEAMGMPFRQLLTPQYQDIATSRYYQRLSGQKLPNIYEVQILCKDGTIKEIEISAALINYGGRPATMTVARDMTQRKALEKQLRESEAKYATVVNEANDGVAIVQNTVFQFVNRSFANTSGYPAADLLGMPFRRLLTPQYQDIVTSRYYQRLSGQKLPNIYEVQIQCKDGSIKDVELSASLIDYHGQPATMTTARDITERKMLERKLLESEMKFRDMAEMSPDWIWETDERARFSYVNPRVNELLGYSVQEMLGRRPSEFIAEEPARKSKDLIDKPGTDYPPFGSSEESVKAKDGHLVFIGTRAIPLYDSQNRFKGYLGISRDITQRKKLERLRMLFLSHVSHEMRTPLATLKGFSSTMLASDVTWTEEEKQDFLQTMDREIDRLTRFINALMDLSQLEMGIFKLNRQYCHIEDIVSEIKTALLTLTHDHSLKLIIPSDLPVIFADCLRLGQVITNLVDNATKYSPQGSPIVISASIVDNNLIISVTDKGPGISTNSQPLLFDNFFREKSALTEKKSGMGLGLAICKGIVEEHGGKIWIESQHRKGSKFSFSIPLISIV
ncbi:MAG: PAS domain S-box protein [Dehalococcoidia bacterium]